MVTWQGVNEFVAVAEAGSFTKASERVGASTAHVSRQISLLEERLNVRLFMRTTRSVSLTPEGRAYYQHCRVLVEGLKEAETMLSDLKETPSGSIKMTAPVTYGEQVVMPMVVEYMRQYPDVSIEVVLSNKPLDLVETGCDIAIRLGRLTDSSMVAKKLATRRLITCASPHYLAQRGTPHTISELDLHNCLCGYREYWRFRENGTERNIRVSGSLRCNSGLALCDAAKNSLGIIQLPDYYVDSAIQSGELTHVLQSYQDDEEGIWALFPHRRLQPRRVRALVDFFAQRLNESGSDILHAVSS
ncbi:LysR family transcriptional regulator [Veronia pacifica]|uniref:LysR family transcriptional regulator n=1 Tax=Veronia pacifica TaxID=1080227 RepID=A0A1C3EGH7_9GAMM|nr:LysR family transcriptional regulator [Veronia pacifica]ODA32330.1 LysR family transcriptional regulator [Veronia pacifica]